MATAVSLRSEGCDHYVFAMDTSAQLTIEGFCGELCKEWWTEEYLSIEASTSDQFEQRELERAISAALEENNA